MGVRTGIDTVTLNNAKGKKPIALDYSRLRKVVLTLRALNHELRQKMIELLQKNKVMPVTDIYVQLRLEQSVASQHLAILRRAGVVNTVREGKFIRYSLNVDRVKEIDALINKIDNY